jgi:hypothetical protein
MKDKYVVTTMSILVHTAFEYPDIYELLVAQNEFKRRIP